METSEKYYLKTHLFKVIPRTLSKWVFFIPIIMENKKGFVLYSDQRNLIELLTNEQAGLLFKHIFAYVNDENPVSEDQIINVVFEPIKQQLKRDLVKWEKTKEDRSKAGLASAESRRINKIQQSSTSVNSIQQEPTKPTVKVNVNVNDNVNVNVNDNVILLEKETKFDFKKSCIDYGFKIELINDWLQVRKNKKLTNTETAFKQFIRQVEINEHDKNIILEKCIEKSWGGFESDWFKTNNINFNKTNTGNNGKSRTDIQQEGKDRFREKFNQQNFGDWHRD